MIIKVNPDKEKVKSILYLAEEREKFVSIIDYKNFPTNAVENYYEIVKELATGLILVEGFKATGENAHKDLIEYLVNYKEINEEDIFLMNDLRIKRNNSSYEGKRIDCIYLENNKEKILKIINKLKKMINIKLKV